MSELKAFDASLLKAFQASSLKARGFDEDLIIPDPIDVTAVDTHGTIDIASTHDYFIPGTPVGSRVLQQSFPSVAVIPGEGLEYLIGLLFGLNGPHSDSLLLYRVTSAWTPAVTDTWSTHVAKVTLDLVQQAPVISAAGAGTNPYTLQMTADFVIGGAGFASATPFHGYVLTRREAPGLGADQRIVAMLPFGPFTIPAFTNAALISTIDFEVNV